MSSASKGNKLMNSSSPYLLQHAYNPVNWYPWEDEALKKAKEEDKPIIVSIGYSTCHWCHVMEQQSFENEEIAAIMNSNFICIKVDREERPDIDQVYMDAIQTMGLQGGWPLNVFLTPDQKPFYGDTYFPPDGWSQLLKNVAEAFNNKRDQLEESADNFTKQLNESDLNRYKIGKGSLGFSKETFVESISLFEKNFDKINGGMQRTPKFPMPSIWNYLLDVFHQYQNDSAREMVIFTLKKIAYGGIYDHIGGEFARYSTDEQWHVPHFEKMLYDNGQLLSLFAKGHALIPEADFEKTVLQTIQWLENEMLSKGGGYYSALDADSEEEEGKYYCWTYEEFIKLTDGDSELLSEFYNVTETGNWEDGKNILRLLKSTDDFIVKHSLNAAEFKALITRFEAKAYKIREDRVRPALDDKILTSWNGLVIRGLVDSYKAFQIEDISKKAFRTGEFITKNLISDKKLYRNYKNGLATIDAYLEDYAWAIDGLIGLYEISLDYKWLRLARQLTIYAIEYFYDPVEGFFFFTSDTSGALITRKKEIFDNVIPSSNAGMAKNLYLLGHYYQDDDLQAIAKKMVIGMSNLIKEEPEYLSYWASVLLLHSNPITEVVIAGKPDQQIINQFLKLSFGNVLLMGNSSEEREYMPLTTGKEAINNKVTFYVCRDKTCQLPVTNINSAIDQVKI